MALQATIYNFDIELADSDRGVYESLALRVACHPSESQDHLIARVLAYLLEFVEGIAFSRGVSDPDVTTADHDDRVVPSHSFKFAATLQVAQGCDKPVLIRIETQASHAYRPTDKGIAELAECGRLRLRT